jgi:hypothetical protein
MEIKYPSEASVSIYERSHVIDGAVTAQFTVGQATKAQGRSRGIALLFL